MTSHPGSGASGPAPEAAPGKWRLATLVIACPTCAAAPGSMCTDQHVPRAAFHLARYELARTLAGEPIHRSTT